VRPTTAARYGRHAAHTDTLGTLAGLGCLASILIIFFAVGWFFVKLMFYLVVWMPYVFIKGIVEEYRKKPLQ
jgi:hypothetical protein